jgi:hypothetical protein
MFSSPEESRFAKNASSPPLARGQYIHFELVDEVASLTNPSIARYRFVSLKVVRIMPTNVLPKARQKTLAFTEVFRGFPAVRFSVRKRPALEIKKAHVFASLSYPAHFLKSING